MTRKELSQLHYLKRELSQEQARLKQLENDWTDINDTIPAEVMAQIVDSKAVIAAKTKLMAIEYNRMCRFVAAVDDSMMRQIITQRFINGKSWRQVAQCIGGGNTEDSVKKACYRFLKSCPECPEEKS